MKHSNTLRRDGSIVASCRREISLQVRKVESKKLYRRSKERKSLLRDYV